MRRRSFTKRTLAILALCLLSGCTFGPSGNTHALREPGFRASMVRRPALLVRVSVSDELSQRERDRIPEDYQAAVVEGLDRLGILVVDVAIVPGGRGRAVEGRDRAPALARAREAGADHLVIVDARLSRGELSHCKQSGRTRAGITTYWDAGLEIDRVSDGKPFLVDPPAEDLRAVDVELDCKTGRLIRRRSMDELITDSVGLILAPFASR
jgi:hypothetical protein